MHGDMAISPDLTFVCEFAVEEFLLGATEGLNFSANALAQGTQERCWSGSGEGQASFGKGEGLVGRKPAFKLSGGWLTLMPSNGLQRAFPARWFSDNDNQVCEPDYSGNDRDLSSVSTEGLSGAWFTLMPTRAFERAFPAPAPRFSNDYSSTKRDLSSFSVLVGQALDKLLRVGDRLRIERDANGDFRYAVARDSEAILSVGSVAAADTEGAFGVWQEHDSYPNPNAEQLKRKFPQFSVAAEISVHREYVTARVNDQTFRLDDNDEVDVPPYFIFLARSNKNVPVPSFEFTPRAVHGAGRMDLLGKEWITAAAQQQTAVQIRML